jgi:hypothetical protein
MPVIRVASVTAATGLALLTCSLPARADGTTSDVKQACVASSTDGQALRDSGKLTEAREKLVACARDECPVIVRKYCAEWLAQVEDRIPSVVFRAQTADGGDVTDATVTVDGGAAHAVDGTATRLDPGEHSVRFEHRGDPAVEMHVVVAETEKGRIVSARFAAKAVAPEPSPESSAPPASGGGGVSPVAIALAGVGVLGLGSFAYFGLTASSDLNNLRQTCAPTCASSDLDAVKQKALFADISLGVGVAALGAAAVVFFTSRSEPSAAALLDVRPTPGGAVARVGGRF